MNPEIREIYAQCRKCLITETLILVDDKLNPHPKFIQVDDIIYHVCGECKIIGDKK